MNILITRPLIDSEDLMGKLFSLGHKIVHIPTLKISAANIGPVDESALYYLRSRGLNKNEAMKMIISSFIEEDLQYIDKKNVVKIINNLSEYLNDI